MDVGLKWFGRVGYYEGGYRSELSCVIIAMNVIETERRTRYLNQKLVHGCVIFVTGEEGRVSVANRGAQNFADSIIEVATPGRSIFGRVNCIRGQELLAGLAYF